MPSVEQSSQPNAAHAKPRAFPLGLLLAALGALAGLSMCVIFWRTHILGLAQPGDNLPYLYLTEMALLAMLALWAAYRARRAGEPLWPLLTWASAGATAGFSFMGMFSIGLAFAPGALLVFIGALAGDVRQRRSVWPGLGVIGLAAAGQAAAMLALVALA